MVFVIVDDENRNRNIGNAVGLGSFGRGHVGDDTKLLALEGGGVEGKSNTRGDDRQRPEPRAQGQRVKRTLLRTLIWVA